MREFTSSQTAALTGGGKLVLAGAGSGKTTVLTERYITLLSEPDIQPREIVAMTFSRKAAANLQAKIHSALLERQRMDTANADHWRRQREQMPWARIGTIHSICAGLLRAFPQEAEVDPEFVLGERADDRDDMLQQRLHRLAWQRDRDYAALLEVLGSRKEVEGVARLLMDRPDIVDSIRASSVRKEEALDVLEAAYLKAFDDIGLDAGQPSRAAHTTILEILAILLRVIEPLLRKEGEATDQLTFDDVEFHALRLMEKNGSAAKRIRESVRFLLVDEFQDTSTRQWKLIRSLVAEKNGTPDLDRLFLVGDDKQSIYGFRSANVTVVESARQAFEASGKPESEWFVRLDDNFRSVPGVLNPLNEAFSRLLPGDRKKALPFEALSAPLKARREDVAETSPSVELLLGLEMKDEEVFANLAERIKSDLETVKIVDPDAKEPDTLRSLRPEDIGILFRTRTNQPLLEKALRDAGIPFRVTGGRGFMQQQEVLDLVHLLTALADPRDQVALVGLLRSPLFNLSDEALAAILFADANPQHGWRALALQQESVGELLNDLEEEDREALKRSWTWWSRWNELVEHRGPTETLMEALEVGGAWAAFAVGSRGEQRIANLYRFLDVVRGFAGEGNYTLRRLVERVHREMESPGEESEKEAELTAEGGVAVMTIHAAKGLEFPYVVLPDLSTRSKSRGKGGLRRGNLLIPEGPFAPLADPGLAKIAEMSAGAEEETLHAAMFRDFAPLEEVAERLRLMYVAATRARDRLLLISPVKVRENKKEGRRLDIPENSHLAEWMKALGLELSLDGVANGPDIDGVNVRLLEKGKPPSGKTVGKHQQNKQISEVRLLSLPEPDRWMLPFTSFTSWLVNPTDEETLRLIWFTGDLREAEAFGEEEETAAVGRGEALLVGDLVHRMYQLHGPGCAWGDVRDEIVDELRRGLVSPESEAATRERIQKLLTGGNRLELQRISDGAFRELSIALRLGPVTLRGKADLAWRDGDTVHVLDYKTNRMNGGSAASVAEEHGYDHQVRLYGLSLMKAWGLCKAVCEVAFLDSAEKAKYQMNLEDESGYIEHAKTLVAKWSDVSRKGWSLVVEEDR